MRLKTAILLACLCVLTSCAEVAYAQLGPAIGNITTSGATCSATSPSANCVTLKLDGSTGAATILITGTFVGTGQFEVSNDGLSTWTNINCTPPNSTTAASSATAAGSWQCNVAGWEHIRVRASAFVSGTMSVVINGAHASAKSGGGAVYASGLGTVNVIPKGNGAGQLADSSCTDNATTVACTEPVNGPAGAAATPTFGTSAAAGNGIILGSGTGGWAISSNRLFFINGGLFQVASGQPFSWTNSSTDAGGGTTDLILRRRGAANLAFGAADLNGSPVAQTINVQNAVTGTDLAGSVFTIDAPLGTGAGAGAATKLNRAQILGTGTTAQTGANAFVVCETKILSNTTATTTAIATVALASNSGGGITVFHSLTATDGTNFDSETQSYNASFVNKAGAITVSTLTVTASSAANNSGSATIGATVTGASPTISLKVTPVYTTIVPTTVTLYTTIINHGAGAVTCN